MKKDTEQEAFAALYTLSKIRNKVKRDKSQGDLQTHLTKWARN